MKSGTSARRTALITGATAGIGAAFARRLAASGHDLVLVARNGERLEAYAQELSHAHGGQVHVLPADLSTTDGCERVEERLRAASDDGDGAGARAGAGGPVSMLVNNAGTTLNRPFLRSSPDEEERLLRLNVNAVMRLTLAVLPSMVERGTGNVINVSSVSAFAAVMPGSTYPASKAWVRNFSESIGLSVKPFGVRVMALCPGYTRTEFHQRAAINTAATPNWMWLDADDVVREGLHDLARGKLVSVPDWRYKTAVFAMRHLPRGILQLAAKDTRGRIGRESGVDVSPDRTGNLSD